jgi:hypothetical protein
VGVENIKRIRADLVGLDGPTAFVALTLADECLRLHGAITGIAGGLRKAAAHNEAVGGPHWGFNVSVWEQLADKIEAIRDMPAPGPSPLEMAPTLGGEGRP